MFENYTGLSCIVTREGDREAYKAAKRIIYTEETNRVTKNNQDTTVSTKDGGVCHAVTCNKGGFGDQLLCFIREVTCGLQIN